MDEVDRLKDPRYESAKGRPAKPGSLEAAQDWYWLEEFPQGSGIEPGTGNMCIWFHGNHFFKTIPISR